MSSLSSLTESISNYDVAYMCEFLDDKALASLMKSSKQTHNICLQTWKIRQRDKRNQLKQCLKSFMKDQGVVFKIIKDEISHHKYDISLELRALIDEYSNKEDEEVKVADIPDEEDDETGFFKVLDAINNRLFSEFLDRIVSNSDLVMLRNIIKNWAQLYSIDLNIPDCLDITPLGPI